MSYMMPYFRNFASLFAQLGGVKDWSRVRTATVIGVSSVVGFSTWAGVRLRPAIQLHARSFDGEATGPIADASLSGGSKLPRITLYQYETCPFCSKFRAFLDYYGIEYEKVEVHPVFKKEIQFSSYKKVPIMMAGEIQVNDSSCMVSVVRTAMLQGGDVKKALEMYPELHKPAKIEKEFEGEKNSERGNKYNIMYGNTEDIDSRSEERRWRKWVDDTLIHVLAPNIYATPRQSLQAFRYIAEVSNFNPMERYLAKYVGAASMYVIAKLLRKKYKYPKDVRGVMSGYVDIWMKKGVGKKRKFQGGDKPNLADLAVFGVLRATEGLDTFDDVMSKRALKWYRGVEYHVNNHTGANSANN